MENKIIVIDDDPTGSQTVHGYLLPTRWDVNTLLASLTDASPLFFVLSNTRSMEAAQAAVVTREICVNLRAALDRLAAEGKAVQPILVSRSDSPCADTIRLRRMSSMRPWGRLMRFFGAGLLRGRAGDARQRPLSHGRRQPGAGGRDRVRLRFGIRLPP